MIAPRGSGAGRRTISGGYTGDDIGESQQKKSSKSNNCIYHSDLYVFARFVAK